VADKIMPQRAGGTLFFKVKSVLGNIVA